MDALFDTSDRRDAANAHRQRALYDAHIRARDFKQAAAVRSAHPALALPAVPRFVDRTGGDAVRTALYVAADRPAIERRAVDVDDGARVLIGFHPCCPHSLAAFRAIALDPLLSAAFADRAVWLAPVDGLRDIEAFRQWAATHPATPVGIIHRRSEWNELAPTATPVFHFLSDGRISGTVEGWPGPKQTARLLAALNEYGWVRSDGARGADRPRGFDPHAAASAPLPVACSTRGALRTTER